MKDNLRYTILYVRISKDDDAAGDSTRSHLLSGTPEPYL